MQVRPAGIILQHILRSFESAQSEVTFAGSVKRFDQSRLYQADQTGWIELGGMTVTCSFLQDCEQGVHAAFHVALMDAR